ncbi:MAG: hypothetical protein R3F04_02970 [Lysobacteraceae bacterium]
MADRRRALAPGTGGRSDHRIRVWIGIVAPIRTAAVLNMGLQAADVARIVQANLPVLCLDTCSILDIMRDTTRDTASPQDLMVALDLVDRIEVQKTLVALVCEQTRIEFAEHVDHIAAECGKNLQKFDENIRRIDEIAKHFGANGTTTIGHMQGHPARARAVSQRLLDASEPAPQSPKIRDRAFDRVYRAIAPAQRAKDSLKDCIVIETYFEAIHRLRQGGLSTPVVFLSSNTTDYQDQAKKLHSNLRAEFDALGMEYAPNFGAARHSLGL